MTREEFITISTDLNLFFQRIMKEHMFFIQTNLQPVEKDNIAEANRLKQGFEQLLTETVNNAMGVSEDVIKSNELVTMYTLRAEEINMKLTGASINTEITKREMKLTPGRGNFEGERLERTISDINARSLNLLKEVIAFKKKLLQLSSECKIFISIYHSMLEHIIHEAEYYQEILQNLQQRRLPRKTLCDELNFWNNIMSEHAQFIDGMLDPSEKALKQNAEAFTRTFGSLVERCIRAGEMQVLQRSMTNMNEFKNYKQTAALGILQCQIESVIPALLADHVLREANHYLRLLSDLNTRR